MRPWWAITAALGLCLLTAAPAWAAPPAFKNCPMLGVMPDYEAGEAPEWRNWDARRMRVDDGQGGEADIAVFGAVCVQTYAEKQGKTEGSSLEISENYKAAMQKLGAEIKHDQPGYVVGHLLKDGKETWFSLNSSRDDGYEVAEVFVAPFKPTLLPPGGNDYRLIGHMPGYTAGTPDKKNFAEHTFPTSGDDVAIRGRLYSVEYEEPAKPPERKISTMEIIENYRQALHELGAEMLRDDGPDSEVLSARVDDHGQMIYLVITANRIVAIEEKPFQMTIKPPTADAMKDQLEKEGHIALYVNFDFAKATLKPDAAPVIEQVVALLKRNPGLKVSIEGHTDGIGGHDYNLKLSEDRAAAVVAAVEKGGVDASRLASAGYGPDKPIATNDTDEGRAKNRRVELVKAE